tara:strand:+ start:131 stop:631 length:501 start_codon:yes stop_codon:yes gene_type:complete
MIQFDAKNSTNEGFLHGSHGFDRFFVATARSHFEIQEQQEIKKQSRCDGSHTLENPHRRHVARRAARTLSVEDGIQSFQPMGKKGLWDDFFLLYEKKLTLSGCSSTEVTYELISMLTELGVENIVRLERHAVDPQQKYTSLPMRMEIRSVLKSLGVKSTTVKLQVS